MVTPVVASVTRESIAPGVQAGSGSPPMLTQPVVLVRSDGCQALATTAGSGTAAASAGARSGRFAFRLGEQHRRGLPTRELLADRWRLAFQSPMFAPALRRPSKPSGPAQPRGS